MSHLNVPSGSTEGTERIQQPKETQSSATFLYLCRWAVPGCSYILWDKKTLGNKFPALTKVL